MDNSKKSTPSSSTHIFQESHGDANPSFLPEQHPNPITNPSSLNVPSFMLTQTFPPPVTFQGAQHPNLIISRPPSFNVPNLLHNPTLHSPVIPEGARYSFDSAGYIVSNTGGLNEMNQTFQGETFVLEIPIGFDVISGVKQFAQRFQLSLSVLCGDGLISEVDFMYPQSRTTPRSISGCYQIISFSGTYSFPNTASGMSNFTVELVDAQGIYSVGGLVASTMKAASIVTLVVTN